MKSNLNLGAVSLFATAGIATSLAFYFPSMAGLMAGLAVFNFGCGIVRTAQVYGK